MKTLTITLVLILFSTINLHAYSDRGFKAFAKLCQKCHGTPFKGATMLTTFEWQEMFAEDDKQLKAVHKDVPELLERLDTSYYEKKRNYLKRFVEGNSYDAGKAAVCDGNSCGD